MQISQGLAAAHGKGIVHRDLKPDNIFVTKGGGSEALDFALAKLTSKAGDGTSPADGPTMTSAHARSRGGDGHGELYGPGAGAGPRNRRPAAISSASVRCWRASAFRGSAPAAVTAVLREARQS